MKNRLRRITELICSALFLIAAGRCVWVGIVNNRGVLGGAIVLIITLMISYGLFKQYIWALWFTVVLFLLLAVILPVGIFNPFTAGDYFAAGKEPPTIGRTLLWLIPMEALLLSAIYLLDPRTIAKKE
jgi:hypothetical protein